MRRMMFVLWAAALLAGGIAGTSIPPLQFAARPNESHAQALESASLEEALTALSLPEDALGGQQFILVEPDGTHASVTCFEWSPDGWYEVESLIQIEGHVGRNGVNADRRMGDGTTPTGLYALGFAFGTAERPATSMEWRAVTENSYWTGGESALAWFNRWVERDRIPADAEIDWSDTEHLIDHRSYSYSIVIEFNTGTDKENRRGYAIFFHSDIGIPTQGCVSVPQEQMAEILGWLDPDKAPQILIRPE